MEPLDRTINSLSTPDLKKNQKLKEFREYLGDKGLVMAFVKSNSIFSTSTAKKFRNST